MDDNSEKKKTLSDEELTQLAIQKIMEETKKASIRAEIVGVSGWLPSNKNVNKKFLNNTLLANSQFNRRRDKCSSNGPSYSATSNFDEIPIKRTRRKC